jgi:hypothetical protein
VTPLKTLVSLAIASLSTAAMAANRGNVADDGKQTVIAHGAGSGHNHTFRNLGADTTIKVVVYNANGTVYTAVDLGFETDVVVHVPSGGSVVVEDTPSPDSDSNGADFEYTV